MLMQVPELVLVITGTAKWELQRLQIPIFEIWQRGKDFMAETCFAMPGGAFFLPFSSLAEAEAFCRSKSNYALQALGLTPAQPVNTLPDRKVYSDQLMRRYGDHDFSEQAPQEK